MEGEEYHVVQPKFSFFKQHTFVLCICGIIMFRI